MKKTAPVIMSGKVRNLINLFSAEFLQLQAYTITEYSCAYKQTLWKVDI